MRYEPARWKKKNFMSTEKKISNDIRLAVSYLVMLNTGKLYPPHAYPNYLSNSTKIPGDIGSDRRETFADKIFC